MCESLSFAADTLVAFANHVRDLKVSVDKSLSTAAKPTLAPTDAISKVCSILSDGSLSICIFLIIPYSNVCLWQRNIL